MLMALCALRSMIARRSMLVLLALAGGCSARSTYEGGGRREAQEALPDPNATSSSSGSGSEEPTLPPSPDAGVTQPMPAPVDAGSGG